MAQLNFSHLPEELRLQILEDALDMRHREVVEYSRFSINHINHNNTFMNFFKAFASSSDLANVSDLTRSPVQFDSVG